MNDILDGLVLSETLERQLRLLEKYPEKFPKFLVFHAEPGVGKTTVAKRLADKLATDVAYLPVNESGVNKEFFERVIKKRLHSVTLDDFTEGDCSKRYSRIFIIDEFHNVAKSQQDKFKTIYDLQHSDVKFIFVLNTDFKKKKFLHHVLTPPMISRCKSFNFDVIENEKEQLLDRAEKVFPHLDRQTLSRLFPDYRSMAQENELASLFVA